MILLLQTCFECGTVQYPARAVCRRCLSDHLADVTQPSGGTLLAKALIRVSIGELWSAQLPVAAGTVLMDAGVQAIVLLEGDVSPGTRTTIQWREDKRHGRLLVAKPLEERV